MVQTLHSSQGICIPLVITVIYPKFHFRYVTERDGVNTDEYFMQNPNNECHFNFSRALNTVLNFVYTYRLSLLLFLLLSFSVLPLKGWDPVDCGATKFDTLLEENKRSFMWTVYSSICIFNSDLFSEGLSKIPEGSISLTAPSPPLLWDLHPTTTQTKLLFLPQECSCESEQLLSGLDMQNRSREGKTTFTVSWLNNNKRRCRSWCTFATKHEVMGG